MSLWGFCVLLVHDDKQSKEKWAIDGFRIWREQQLNLWRPADIVVVAIEQLDWSSMLSVVLWRNCSVLVADEQLFSIIASSILELSIKSCPG